jgi:inner membrane protein
MPTLLSHPAVPLALGLGLGARRIPRRLLVAGVMASMLPDLDVAAFALHIPYAHAFGHRGASHSLFFALLLGLLALAAARWLGSSKRSAFLFVFVAAASHGLLDMLTNGGLGVALWWPGSEQRLFFPWQVIEVSPIGPRFFSGRGLEVLRSEFLWIWIPCACAGLLLFLGRRIVLEEARQ